MTAKKRDRKRENDRKSHCTVIVVLEAYVTVSLIHSSTMVGAKIQHFSHFFVLCAVSPGGTAEEQDSSHGIT